MRIKAFVAALLLLCTPAFGQATKATCSSCKYPVHFRAVKDCIHYLWWYRFCGLSV